MRLTATVDYALRAAIELAAVAPELMTAEEIGRAQGLPVRFLEKILRDLRRAGIVRSHRGPEGGFELARLPNEVSLADVIRAVEGPLTAVRDTSPSELSYPGVAAPLREVFVALRANERAVLEAVSLAHIAEGKLPQLVHDLVSDPEAWGQGSRGTGWT